VSDAAGAVQTAVITKYRGDATLQGLMAPGATPEWNIFDAGGSGQITPSFPYVIVHPGIVQLGTVFGMGVDGQDIYLQVSVFTQDEGFTQARAIASRIYALTHGPLAGPFTLTGGFTNVGTWFNQRLELEHVDAKLVQQIADKYKMMVQG
jgi:hypothetical protein